MAGWNVEYTDQFEAWWLTLSMDEKSAITAAVELLERQGPALGRPMVDILTALGQQGEPT